MKVVYLAGLLLLGACATAQEKADEQMCLHIQQAYNQNPGASAAEIYKEVTLNPMATPQDVNNFFMVKVASACGKYLGVATVQTLQNKARGEYKPVGNAEFAKISGGRKLAEGGLGAFAIDGLKDTLGKPQKNLVYYYSDSGLGYKLRVFQNVKGGVIVEAREGSARGDNLLFLKTSQKYADGDSLNSGYYVYDGLFQYNSILGIKRTIYSFKELKKK